MRLAVVSPGHTADNGRLQPWVYLERLVQPWLDRGDAILVGDPGSSRRSRRPAPMPSGRSPARLIGGPPDAALRSFRPDVAVWSVGPTSVLRHRRERIRASARNVVAFVPGPLYSLAELAASGAWRPSEVRDHAVHGLASAVPPSSFTRFLAAAADAVVVPTQVLRCQLEEAGLDPRRIHVIPCGKDPAWDAAPPAAADWLAGRFPDGRFVVNFGPARPVRGVFDLAEAARRTGIPCLFLVRGGPARAVERLRRAVPSGSWIHDGLLGPDEVRAIVARSWLCALPLRIVQSVVPVAALESLQAGVPVVATRVPPLPEVVGRAGEAVAGPRDPATLAESLQRLWAPAARAEASRHARLQMAGHPSWPECSRRFAAILEDLG